MVAWTMQKNGTVYTKENIVK